MLGLTLGVNMGDVGFWVKEVVVMEDVKFLKGEMGYGSRLFIVWWGF